MFATTSTADWFEVLGHLLTEILGYHGCFYEDSFSSGMWRRVIRYMFVGIFLNLTFSIISAGEVIVGAVGSFVTPGKSTALPIASWKTIIFTFWLPCRICSEQLEMSYRENKWTVVDILLHLKNCFTDCIIVITVFLLTKHMLSVPSNPFFVFVYRLFYVRRQLLS